MEAGHKGQFHEGLQGGGKPRAEGWRVNIAVGIVFLAAAGEVHVFINLPFDSQFHVTFKGAKDMKDGNVRYQRMVGAIADGCIRYFAVFRTRLIEIVKCKADLSVPAALKQELQLWN